MNRWISVVGLCLVAHTVGYTVKRNTVLSDLNLDGTGKEINCPTTELCTMKCPLGYKTDDRGCSHCEECETEGTFESDILVDSRTYGNLLLTYGMEQKTATKSSRAGYSQEKYQWPSVDGEVSVPYTFNSSIPIGSWTYSVVRRAIDEYHNKTCIRFVNRTTERNYIEFTSGKSECSSFIGMIGGKQKIVLAPGCVYQIGTSLHELMHALGFWHEQSRPDRDNYVRVLWNNIQAGFEGNFQKMSRKEWNSYNSSYDTGSVMHYGGYYFSKNITHLSTIVDALTNQSIVAQRNGFSSHDLHQINTKYGCTAYLQPSTTTAAVTKNTTTTTTKQLPTTTTPCKDYRRSCRVLQMLGNCEFMEIKNVCPKSCGVCISSN